MKFTFAATLWCWLSCLGSTVVAAAASSTESWRHLLETDSQSDPIVANGNVWPPLPTERRDACLLLVADSQLIRSCPLANNHDGDGESTEQVLYAKEGRRIRGAFSAEVTDSTTADLTHPQRIWILTSPVIKSQAFDLIQEIDLPTQQIVQTLRLPQTGDAHDAVRVGNSVFIADTKNGHVMEIALPRSAPVGREDVPSEEDLIENPEWHYFLREVTVIARHPGFTRADHINNLAVHKNVLLTSLHGKDGLNPKLSAFPSLSSTRLSVLRRDLAGKEVLEEGFKPVTNAGTWCHGIAFWQRTPQDPIHLVSLDSKTASLVMVDIMSDQRTRTVMWEPDLSHPVLNIETEPEELPTRIPVFAKGLAVQGGVAFFSISKAGGRKWRQHVNPTLLVAVDLTTGKELAAKPIQSHGLVHQVVTQSYLGLHLTYTPPPSEYAQLAASSSQAQLHEPIETDLDRLAEAEIAKIFDRLERNETTIEELLYVEFPDLRTFNMTRPEGKTASCLDDESGETRRLDLETKKDVWQHKLPDRRSGTIIADDEVAISVCQLDVSAVEAKLREEWDHLFFDDEYAARTNVNFTNKEPMQNKFKPGVKGAVLIFSQKMDVYHFPWLQDWLPLLQETILTPLQLPLDKIIRMQFALMPKGAMIRKHVDRGPWVNFGHRTHVPIVTHDNIFFNAEVGMTQWLRIPSKWGQVYEFNNQVPHAVRNYGGDRVHLIIDWVDEPWEEATVLEAGLVCENTKGGLDCYHYDENEDEWEDEDDEEWDEEDEEWEDEEEEDEEEEDEDGVVIDDEDLKVGRAAASGACDTESTTATQAM